MTSGERSDPPGERRRGCVRLRGRGGGVGGGGRLYKERERQLTFDSEKSTREGGKRRSGRDERETRGLVEERAVPLGAGVELVKETGW